MTAPNVRTFRTEDGPAIRRIMDASLAADRLPGIDSHDVDRSLAQLPDDPEGTAVALDGDQVVGYCTPRSDDLTVHPRYRRRGHGRRLVDAALEIVRRRGLHELILYGPTHLLATRAFVDALGFRYHSSLWRFQLGDDTQVPPPSFPPGFTARSYRGQAELASYVWLMNAAFADHPTPASWTEQGIAAAHARPGFDPGGILLVVPDDQPDQPVGFVRVRLDPASSDPGGAPTSNGEVALIGVLPEWRGRGLGRELLRWGVAHLRAAGADNVRLSVQALNERATRIYRDAGFRPEIEWPQFALDVGGS